MMKRIAGAHWSMPGRPTVGSSQLRLSGASSHHICGPVRRITCLEGRRKGVRNRRLEA